MRNVLQALDAGGFNDVTVDGSRVRSKFEELGVRGQLTITLSPASNSVTVVHVASSACSVRFRMRFSDPNRVIVQAFKMNL